MPLHSAGDVVCSNREIDLWCNIQRAMGGALPAYYGASPRRCLVALTLANVASTTNGTAESG